MIKRLYLLT